jgi:hypothetical protein
MWGSWVKEKGTTHVMYVAKLKDGPKRVKKNLLNDFGKGFWNGMMEGEKMGSHKKGSLKLKCLSPLKMLTSPLFEETLTSSLFLPLSFFFAPSLENLGVWWYLRRKSLPQKLISNGFNILVVDTYSWVELCMLTWLNHDYGDGGVLYILAVDAYSRVELWTPIFLGEASN